MSIELIDVQKAFGPKVVLDGVTLQVAEGETVAVIGYSGSGKSVLLKTIVGLLPPDAGSVRVDGQEVVGLGREALFELRRRIGYVFQFAALFDSMTVAENVGMGLRRVPGMMRRRSTRGSPRRSTRRTRGVRRPDAGPALGRAA